MRNLLNKFNCVLEYNKWNLARVFLMPPLLHTDLFTFCILKLLNLVTWCLTGPFSFPMNHILFLLSLRICVVSMQNTINGILRLECKKTRAFYGALIGIFPGCTSQYWLFFYFLFLIKLSTSPLSPFHFALLYLSHISLFLTFILLFS